MTTPAPSGNGDRLNGWKEIAAHLGKGTRTAQRWERDYGLPVRRVGREGGEIVFAFRDEIDRWARRTSLGSERTEPGAAAEDEGDSRGAAGERPSASERRALGRRRAAAWVLAVVTVVAAAIGVLVLRAQRGSARRPEAVGPPAAWELSGGALTVRDAVGRQVFRHEFGSAMAPARFSSSDPPDRRAQARIEDLDGDGRPEVLVHCTIGPDPTVTQAAVSSEYAALHARLEKAGQLDHRLGPRDDADMFPVRVFDAAGARELKRVAVSR